MTQPHEEMDDVDAEEYIQHSDVLAEVEEDNAPPMDEDDDNDAEGDGDEGDGVFEDSSISYFGGHEGSVFAVALHPSQPLAVSGGQDDLGYIWRLEDGEVVVKLTGHTDSVSSVGWSHDGELVSTGAMDGKVRIWRRVKNDSMAEGLDAWKYWEFLTELTGPDEVLWLKWHPRGLVLLAGSYDSTVWLWQLPSGNTMQVLASHMGPVSAGCFTPDGKKVLTGSEILLLTTPTVEAPLVKLTSEDARFAMEGGITSLAVNASNSLAVIGGADGGVRVVSLSKGDVVGSLEGHKAGVEAAAWMEIAGSEVALTADIDGKVCIWDLSTMRLRLTLEHDDVIVSLHPHPAPSSHLLTTSSTDKTLRTWDVRTGQLIHTHKGHRAPIFGASLGNIDGRVVVVSGDDDGVCLAFAAE